MSKKREGPSRLRRRVYDWLHVLLPAVLLAAAVWLRREDFRWVQAARNLVFDNYQRLSPRPDEEAPVRVVDLDDETLEKLGQWPWPRTLLAELVDRLREAGATVVAFDICFAEPDRTSPARLAEQWAKDPSRRELAARLKRLPDHDEFLAAALKRSKVVTGFFADFRRGVELPRTIARFKSSEPIEGLLTPYSGAARSLPVLEASAAGNACLTIVAEPDSIIRRAPLVSQLGDEEASATYPSLSLEALRIHLKAPGIVIRTEADAQEAGRASKRIGIAAIEVGTLRLPTDREGRLWLHFAEDNDRRTVPAWKALQGKLPPKELEGKIALVGTSAAGLKDIRATPLTGALPGVHVHATVIEQALLGRFLQRPVWADGAEILFLVLLGAVLIGFMKRLGPGWCATLGGLTILTAFVVSWHSFTTRGWLLDPFYPAFTCALIYLASSLITYLKSEAERKQVRNAFSRYMHPKLVEELARHPEKLRLGGETRPMTILFCDIRGFTTISEQYDAQGLTHVINRFLTPMTTEIMERRGYIDKYIGDCIMAFWNAPLDDGEHAKNACKAALAMITGLTAVNETLRREADAAGKAFHEIHIGVGLNTGDCCVGNMGSDQRFNYSVLGDDVNLASRLEGQSKSYGVDIVIGPKTRELAREFAALELDLIKVKGKTRPVRIFTLLGDRAVSEDPAFKDFAAAHSAMLEAYRAQDWDEARKRLDASAKLSEGFGLEKLRRLYEGRIEAYRVSPPGKGWDGAYTALTK